ncbi:MAG: 2-oxoacid:ferredoxin oxidoreductase subunit beta [Planctomycetota bacterium]|nr:MAG: 2-oxoacid:ferredoxin oxidoreductase subunit beta [Planctomycetota bacterium]
MTQATVVKLKKKDFESDQEVRWCPGCGDYAILAAIQRTMPELGIPREKLVFVSGIGCSSRFPYYMNTYGFHTIHGRAPAFATGIKCANPELSVWQITGDGDGLSIGGNHLLHVLRRNPDINILLFNNRIYGLTKGQYSPTSEKGKITKSTPYGSIDQPVNPLKFAIASGATFVARTMDADIKHMMQTFKAAAAHKGVAFIEIMQNCPIFNDGAWKGFTAKKERPERVLYLEHGKPMLWGKKKNRGLVLDGFDFRERSWEEGDEVPSDVLVHDAQAEKSSLAYLMTEIEHPLPVGVFRAVQKPTYEQEMLAQIETAKQKIGHSDLGRLYREGANTWTVAPKD